MCTAAMLLLGFVGAGLLGSFPIASIVCFIGAYYVGRGITLADVEGFTGVVFVLAVVGFGAAFVT